MIPTEIFMKIKNRKNGKDSKGNNFLCYLKLGNTKISRTHSVGRDLQTVFKKRNSPADQDYCPQSGAFVFEVAIPSKGHK